MKKPKKDGVDAVWLTKGQIDEHVKSFGHPDYNKERRSVVGKTEIGMCIAPVEVIRDESGMWTHPNDFTDKEIG